MHRCRACQCWEGVARLVEIVGLSCCGDRASELNHCQVPTARTVKTRSTAKTFRAHLSAVFTMTQRITRATPTRSEYVRVLSMVSNNRSWGILSDLFLLLPTAPAPVITRPHHSLDVSSDVKIAFNFHPQRITGSNKIFKDDVNHMLVENLYVPERVDIELQTLQLDTTLVGHVFDSDCGEIRKVRERANSRKLGNLEVDANLFSGILIGKRV